MSPGPRRLLRELSGRADREFVELLCAQIDSALQAARLVHAVVAEGRDHDFGLRERIGELESEGDAHRAEIVTALTGALVTPIDREDIYRLSRAIDDVLDNLRDFAVEAATYGVEPNKRFIAPLDGLARGLDELADAIGRLADDVAEVAGPARAAKKANDAREAFHDEMGALLRGDEVTMQTLRERELLRRLDVAGLRLATAADALISGALKRG